MDEPGNDVQWYFSENHALLFHTAAYLAGHLLPEARFVRSRRLGAEQSEVGLGRVRAWLDHFEAWEMAEFNSAPYFPIDLKGLTALMALAPHADVRERARKAVVRLVEIVARSAHHGVLTGAQGRSYEHTLRASSSLELSGIARMLWGRGNYGCRFHALPQLALCIRDHGLEIPADLERIAAWSGDDAQEWCFAHRPSYWGGSGTLPRLHHYRGLAVMVFDCAAEQPDFTHAWFPRSAFDAVSLDGDVAAVRGGEGFALLKGSGPLSLVETGPTAGNEIRLAGRKGTWIVRLGDARRNGTLEAFARTFGGLAVRSGAEARLEIDDPDYGRVVFHADGRVEAEGRVVDPSDWTVVGEATRLSKGPLVEGRV